MENIQKDGGAMLTFELKNFHSFIVYITTDKHQTILFKFINYFWINLNPTKHKDMKTWNGLTKRPLRMKKNTIYGQN